MAEEKAGRGASLADRQIDGGTLQQMLMLMEGRSEWGLSVDVDEVDDEDGGEEEDGG